MNTSQPPPAAEAGHHRQIERIIDDLAHDYGDGFDRAEGVETVYRDTYARLERQARVAAFLPVLAQRHTRQRLDAAGPLPTRRDPRSWSPACTTRAARSPPGFSCATTPATESRSAPPAPNPARVSIPSWPRSWPNAASSRRPHADAAGLGPGARPRTWSSRWAAARPAPSFPASDKKTGPSTTPPAKTSTPSGASSTTSRPESANCSPKSRPHRPRALAPSRRGCDGRPSERWALGSGPRGYLLDRAGHHRHDPGGLRRPVPPSGGGATHVTAGRRARWHCTRTKCVDH